MIMTSLYSSGRREGSSYHRRSYSGSKSDNSERQVEVAHNSAPSPSPKPVVGGKEVEPIPSGQKTPYNGNNGSICHNCGEPGHIRPNCPLKSKPKTMARVRTDSESEQSDYM